MGRPRGWATEQTGEASMPSPGRPGVNQLEAKQAFWKCIAKGIESETAALACGVSQPLGPRWFREAGGMPPISLLPCSGRYLSFAEREELALLRARHYGVREIARRLGRSSSTLSRELRRNAATRGGTLTYRATVAQWKAERAVKLAKNERLRTYVQDRLAGMAVGRTGAGAPAGVRSRSAVDCKSTFLMMSQCGSPTKPSIRRSTFKAAARCNANCARVCVQAGRSGCRAPERGNEAKTLSPPR
jgi:transposase, IS30 family